MKTTQDKINKKEKELKELKVKLEKEKIKEENNKCEWIKIPELKIEIQTKIHHKNKTYSECEKDLGKEELISTYEQLQWLRNSKYRDKLNLIDTWEFVQNPDNISKENGYVVRFCANSVCAGLYCVRDASYSVSYLGVRYAKKILKVSKESKK